MFNVDQRSLMLMVNVDQLRISTIVGVLMIVDQCQCQATSRYPLSHALRWGLGMGKVVLFSRSGMRLKTAK